MQNRGIQGDSGAGSSMSAVHFVTENPVMLITGDSGMRTSAQSRGIDAFARMDPAMPGWQASRAARLLR
jgi:hypothetical protein